MEQLRENLLKNGWLGAMDVPLLTHGKMAARTPSTSNLDKWLDDFESKMLNPVNGFEENKDANPDYIQEILTMMFSEKRISQLDKVLVDTTNVRENLLKRGWFIVPVERREASVLSENQRKAKKTDMGMNWNYMESIQLQEHKDDIENLLNMLASKKEATKAGKCREADSESSAPKPKDVNTTDVASALEGCTQKIVTTNKDAIGENTRGHIVKTKSTGTKEKSSKKTIRHGTDINTLVQQGWSVIKKNRHQITMVKVPELIAKDEASAAPKRGSMKIQAKGRQSRKDQFEAQNKNKTTSRPKTTSLGKEELTGNDCEALASAPGVSHKKKTLFRRFLRRSGKLMGRFFTCGRNED